MNLVVDTSVWSLVLRRDPVREEDPHVRTFRACVEGGAGLVLLGPILQELLDGLRSETQWGRLIRALEAIPLAPLGRSVYVRAARMRTDFRKRGFQAGATDFLIAAACIEGGYPLLTADTDFERIAKGSELVLVPPAK